MSTTFTFTRIPKTNKKKSARKRHSSLSSHRTHNVFIIVSFVVSFSRGCTGCTCVCSMLIAVVFVVILTISMCTQRWKIMCIYFNYYCCIGRNSLEISGDGLCNFGKPVRNIRESHRQMECDERFTFSLVNHSQMAKDPSTFSVLLFYCRKSVNIRWSGLVMVEWRFGILTKQPGLLECGAI